MKKILMIALVLISSMQVFSQSYDSLAFNYDTDWYDNAKGPYRIPEDVRKIEMKNGGYHLGDEISITYDEMFKVMTFWNNQTNKYRLLILIRDDISNTWNKKYYTFVEAKSPIDNKIIDIDSNKQEGNVTIIYANGDIGLIEVEWKKISLTGEGIYRYTLNGNSNAYKINLK